VSEHYTDVDVEKAARAHWVAWSLNTADRECWADQGAHNIGMTRAVLDAAAPDIARAAEARGAEKALREAAEDFGHRARVYEYHPEHDTDRYLDGFSTAMRVAEKVAREGPAPTLSAERGSENRSTDSRLFLQSTVRAASEPDDRTPHQHGGTDAPECTRYGVACAPEARPTVADLGVPTSFREQAVRPTTAEQIDAALEAAAQAIEAALLDGGDGSVGGDTAARIVRAQKRGTP
jgi:hypothetical protein